MSTIVFEHVRFARGTQAVLSDVSFTIESGESVALVGRSGAGKSTALKLMNRLLEPASGRVLVHGKETRDWDPFELRRQTGYVLQEIALFPHMTIGENVGLVPRLLGWDAARVRARIDELLGLVDLPRRPTPLACLLSSPEVSVSAWAWRARSPRIRPSS